MRALALALLLSLTAGPSSAEEKPLTGEEIRALLPDILAVSETTRQTFAKNGDTVFEDGRRVTNGRWRIQDNFYCSTWPPGGGWRCYGVLFDKRDNGPDVIVWVDVENGERTINTILPKGQ